MGLRKGDEYCKRWEVNKEGNWSGNLGWSAAVENAIKAVKNEKGQKGSQNHLRVMTKEIMGRLYQKSEEVIAANPNNLQVLARERMFIALGTNVVFV